MVFYFLFSLPLKACMNKVLRSFYFFCRNDLLRFINKSNKQKKEYQAENKKK